MTYVHVVHGWVWKWGQQVGGNASWPCLGGTSGRDDQELNGSYLIQLGINGPQLYDVIQEDKGMGLGIIFKRSSPESILCPHASIST